MFTYHKWITLKLLLIPVVKVEVWNVLFSIDLWMMGVPHLQIDFDFVWVVPGTGGSLMERSLAYSFLRGPRLPLRAVAGSSFVVWSHATCMAPCKFAQRDRERERERERSFKDRHRKLSCVNASYNVLKLGFFFHL
jgi:hypothetical protein